MNVLYMEHNQRKQFVMSSIFLTGCEDEKRCEEGQSPHYPQTNQTHREIKIKKVSFK